VAPPEYTMMHIYKGIMPFVILQLIGLAILVIFPGLTTWLPALFFGAS
jgi:TRAP-type mannitol/chloroaromatic compound transport system permease large subunit